MKCKSLEVKVSSLKFRVCWKFIACGGAKIGFDFGLNNEKNIVFFIEKRMEIHLKYCKCKHKLNSEIQLNGASQRRPQQGY